MLTRQLVLLFVRVVHSVVVRATIIKTSVPYMRIIKILMFAIQSIKPLCMDFWSPYLVQKGVEVRQSITDVTLSPCSGQIWPPSILVHLGSCSEPEFGTTN